MTIEETIAVFEEFANNPYEFSEVKNNYKQYAEWLKELQERRDLPEIIFCKDCVKHNVDMRESLYIEKDQECPLIRYRGKARGHEFDFQFCVYAERNTNGTR